MPELTDLRSSDALRIAGYRVLSRLGTGGQGVVYLALAPSGERVAIKQLLAGFADERARQQFAKEVAAVRRVAPFCTAQILDVHLDGAVPYVVSEYIDGPSLKQQIDRHGPMSGAALHRLAIGTATALAAIHQAGVVHRDVKPANVMLAADGPRVIDFGIAGPVATDGTLNGLVSGTPNYMSPEHLRVERVGPAGDMFAWASVITFAATGRAPFEAEQVMAVLDRISTDEPDLTGVPAEFLGLLRQCLDKDPDRRPSAQQALTLLLERPADQTLVLPEGIGPRLPSAPDRRRPGWAERRWKSPIGVAAAIAVGVVLLAGGGWVLAAGNDGADGPTSSQVTPAASPSSIRATVGTLSAPGSAPPTPSPSSAASTTSSRNGDKSAGQKDQQGKRGNNDGKHQGSHSGKDGRG